MTIYPAAIQRVGPDWKRWPDANTHQGAILHSMEGYEGGAWSQLDGPAQASWHFSVMKDGRAYQHYPIDQSPWHAGTKRGNTTLIGIEHEGMVGEPLTNTQRDASVALVRWLAVECGWLMSRDPATRTLWEHREVGQTTCPNGRIPWEYYAEQEREDTVQVRALDSGETIAAANEIFAHFGQILADTAGETMVEVVEPAPPAGYRTVQITYRQ